MASLSEALAVALEHHQAGRLLQAAEIYRRILVAVPDHPEATHLLGLVAHQSGQDGVALQLLERAVELQPGEPGYQSNLGNAYSVVGRKTEAAAAFRRAIELNPDFAEAHNNLGNILRELEGPAAARACFQRALELRPDYAEAHNNLANVCRESEQFDEAIEHYRRAIDLGLNSVEVFACLGDIHSARADFPRAIEMYERSLRVRARAETYNSLGRVYYELRKAESALACYTLAVQLEPGHALAWSNRADAARAICRYDEALAAVLEAIRLRPGFAEAHSLLGVILKELGRVDEALPHLRQAIVLKPDFAEGHSNYLAALQYHTGVSLAELHAAHAEFGRRHDAPPPDASGKAAAKKRRPRASTRRTSKPKPVRLGFVSPDFRQHPVGRFLAHVLERLDPKECPVACYSDVVVGDEYTRRCRAAAATWHDTFGMPHARVAELIAADRIDVLFDLAGHTAKNRLLTFARKPAPRQVAWIGYEGTTGLAAIDYLLADPYLVPEGTESYYSERVLRLPDGYTCYEPSADAPPVGELPVATRGEITWSAFQNPAKITPQVVAVWAEILRRVPRSRLILKYLGFENATLAGRYRDLFAEQGISAERLEFRGFSPQTDYLASYHEVDLALDTFPFNGGITTCDALWMGVPVITCPGETFAARHSLSHLTNAGVTETIAADLAEYVELAVAWAADHARLAETRAGLRSRLAASPLCDADRMAGNLTRQARAIRDG